jgi:hypothetical protein
VMSGACCKVMVNGKLIGVATSVSIQREVGVKPLMGVDNPLPQELAVTGPYLVRGQINGLRTRSTGGFDGLQLINVSTLNDYFNQKYITIELVDRKTNTTFAKVNSAIFTADSIQAVARQPITISGSFIGTFMTTEISQKSGK